MENSLEGSTESRTIDSTALLNGRVTGHIWTDRETIWVQERSQKNLRGDLEIEKITRKYAKSETRQKSKTNDTKANIKSINVTVANTRDDKSSGTATTTDHSMTFDAKCVVRTLNVFCQSDPDFEHDIPPTLRRGHPLNRIVQCHLDALAAVGKHVAAFPQDVNDQRQRANRQSPIFEDRYFDHYPPFYGVNFDSASVSRRFWSTRSSYPSLSPTALSRDVVFQLETDCAERLLSACLAQIGLSADAKKNEAAEEAVLDLLGRNDLSRKALTEFGLGATGGFDLRCQPSEQADESTTSEMLESLVPSATHRTMLAPIWIAVRNSYCKPRILEALLNHKKFSRRKLMKDSLGLRLHPLHLACVLVQPERIYEANCGLN